MKYPEITWGRMEAVVNKLGGMDGVDRFLRGEPTVSEPVCGWREENGVIYFSVTSDGATGSDWIKRLAEKGFSVTDYAQSILRSPDFTTAKAGTVTEVAVLKGEFFSNEEDCTTSNIRAEADKRGWLKPNAEVACLIREKFSNQEIKAMGLWCVTAMHEPKKDPDGDLILLHAIRGVNGSWLGTYYDNSDGWWTREVGFAFAVAQQG
jgi:hypothetical protein